MKLTTYEEKFKAVIVEAVRRTKEFNLAQTNDAFKRSFPEMYVKEKASILDELGLNEQAGSSFSARDWVVDRALGKAQILDMINNDADLKDLKGRVLSGEIFVDGITDNYPTVKFENDTYLSKASRDSVLSLVPRTGEGTNGLLGNGFDVFAIYDFGKQEVFKADLKSGLIEAQTIVQSFEKNLAINAKRKSAIKMKM